MKNLVFTGLSSLLLPLGAYANSPVGSYQARNYLGSEITSSDELSRSRVKQSRNFVEQSNDYLDIQQAHSVRELVVVDAGIAEIDKLVLRRALKPGLALVELESRSPGLQQLMAVLAGYKNLAAVHIVSHAEAGAIVLGSSRITAENIQQRVDTFAALHGAVREGGDLLFYGCELAANNAGEELLDIIRSETGLDVAASSDFTGNPELNGDWDLEIKRGRIEAELAFSEKSLRDFSSILVASDGQKTFTAGWNGAYSPEMYTADFKITAKGGADIGIYNNSYAFSPNMSGASGNYFYVKADGSNTTAFELTAVNTYEAPGASGRASEFTNVRIVGYLYAGGIVTSSAINGTAGEDTFLFDTELSSFSGQKLKGFKILFDCSTACNGVANDQPAFFSFKSFTIEGAINTPPTPVVTDPRISIGGASGTAGAYIVGDTVTATWNNTAGGDNNAGITGVTVNFSEFGGGTAVVASNSSGTWTATYTITAGAIDATNRNVSITATNASGNTTTADTTNATVDSIAPTVTDARISISGASGTGGAYKIGDVVTATWNNTAGGDNNTDTLSSVTVDFSQFGGGAAVAASNSAGTWTATYTITAGAIDTTSRNVSVTVTDNAGNATTTADTTNATVDSIAPTLTDTYISIGGATGVGGAYKIGDTVTASWDNTGAGDNNSDTISSVTVDFSQFGGGAAVAATNSSGTWSANYTIVAGAIDAINRNISVTATDNAANTRTTSDTTNAIVDNIAPTVSSISPSGSPAANAASMDFAVSFSEAVSNISTDDFTLVTTGTASGTVASVSAASGSSVNVTVNTITGTGTLKLNLNGATDLVDDAGNGVAAYSSGTTHSVDRDAPAAPSTPDLDAASDTGASNTDNVTSDNTPTFTGTAEANSTVTLISSLSGTLGTTVADGSGNWSYTAGAMVNGIHNMTATATDAANNVSSASAALAVTIDGPVTVTTNADAGADATIDGSLATDIADGGGLSLREALSYVAASGTVDFAVGLSGTTITLGSPLTVPAGITLDADALGIATITGNSFTLAGSLNLTNGSGDQLTLASEMTGAGALTKAGAGRLTLTNTNNSTSYSGDVTVTDGDLWIGSDSVFSTGTLILNGGTLGNNMASFTFDNAIVVGASGGEVQVLNAAQILTLSGNISGSGALSKTSGGNLTLSGTNSFSGGLFVSGVNGVSVADSTNLGSGQVTINTSSVLTLTGTAQTITNAIALAGDAIISNANAMTISGVISGSSGLSKAGAGVLTLSATNTATGAVAVTAGGLALANGSALVDTVAVSVSAGANLILPSGSETIGSVAGAGNLVLTGGTLTTGADNSSTSLSGVISGAGSLTKAGTGTFTVSGTSTFSGATQVAAGTLLVTGDLSSGSGVSVASGATLTGTGTAPAITIANGGNLSPGNAGPGLLTVAGNLAVNSGGILVLDVTGTTAVTQYDQLAVTGTVSLTDAAISVTHSYVAANGDAYDVITNDGADAITGTFSGIAEGDSFVAGGNSSNLIVSYAGGTGNDLILTNTLLPGAPTGVSAVAGNSSAVVSFSAPASNGGSAISGYTVTANPGGATATGAASPLSVVGLTNGVAYTFTVTATNATGTGSASAASGAVTPQAPQTITFTNPGAQALGSPLTVTATASSGLTPSFTSSTTSVCTVTSGGVVTLVTIGTCSLSANQAGNAAFSAATPVSQSFLVNPAPNVAPVINQGDSVSVTMSEDGSPTAFSLTLSATDGNSDPLTWSISSSAGQGTASVVAGVVSYTPNANYNGSDSFVVQVSDGSATDSITVNVTVQAVNDAPVITGTPNTSVEQDVAYSFIPNASDVDTGTTLTFSITNMPSWANFNAATGALTGTPAEADVGTTSGIVISVSDGSTSVSLPAFSVEVLNVNAAPVISGTPATSVDQDVAYSFTPTANDADLGDVLIFSIVNIPSWASFDTATGALTGTPAEADVGTTSGIVISVSDGVETVSLPAFDVQVLNVNAAPVISGTPATSVDQDVAYSFTPTASDVDAGDTLTFSILNKPEWASFNSTTGALTGTPAGTDTGIFTDIVISVSDGAETTSLPSFSIEVLGTIDPLQPVVTPPANLELNATALFTPVSLRQLLGLAESATQADVELLLNSLASDGVSGNACCVITAEGLTNDQLLLRPGRHEVQWKGTNAVGVTGEAIQVVNVKPLVSLSKSQIAVRGSKAEFKILLNGPSPVYPLSIPYVIDAATTASAAEHNLSSGVATFSQQGQVSVTIPVQITALSGLSDSQLVVALGDGINAGVSRTHVIDIREGNVAPIVNLNISQGGVHTNLITPTGGVVTLTATVVDANTGDTHSYQWVAANNLVDTDADPVDNQFVFDPSGLVGNHQVQVIVTDSGGEIVQASVYFRVINNLPVLDANTDTDLDGISDLLEGTGDTDDNGIPDYLDNMPSSNILPQRGNTTNAYLVECDPGVRCGLGLFARGGNSGGVQVLDEELGTLDNLDADPNFEPVGGVFDFAIRDLPTPGQSVRVVLPQRAAIPANAVYRKFQRGQWIDFVSDTNNGLHSALGNPGYCPPPGSADWTPGLTEGHMCVQLTIEDGGPNDDDGLVNSAVVDPGGVSKAKTVEPPVEPPKPPVQVKSTGGGAVQGLWLLLLAGFTLVARLQASARARKYLAFGIGLVTACLAAITQAQSPLDKAYLRVDTFMVTSDQNRGDFESALAEYDFTVSQYDTDRSGYQLSLGYRWNEFTYTELGFLDLGDAQVDMTLDGETDLTAFRRDLAKAYPHSAQGLTLGQGISMKLGERFKVSAEAALFIWEGEINLGNASLAAINEDGVDPILGLRLDAPLGDTVTLGVAMRRVFFSEQSLDLLSVGASFQF